MMHLVYFNRRGILLPLCVVVLLLLPDAVLFGQARSPVISYTMTRGNIWIKARPNGALDRETSFGSNSFEMLYPGYYNANTEASGGWDHNAVYLSGQVLGSDIAWMIRNGNYSDADVYSLAFDGAPAQPTKNYNLKNPGSPEEYITGDLYSDKFDQNGNRHMGLKLSGAVMAWSVPKYADFILIKCKLTNQDDDTIKNFYYTRYITPSGPYAPTSVSPGWDKEYIWDPDISDSLGFIFYDDDTKSPVSADPRYAIYPGTLTGNAGDPGNIGTQGSRNFKLYSPWLYAYTFIPVTRNANGEKKIWRKVVSSSSSAPPDELMPGWTSDLKNYTTLMDFVTKNPQPEISWKDAFAANTASPGSVPGAGSLWERNPRYVYAIGPFNIPKGQSVEWFEVLLCGGMDRDKTMRGILDDSLITTKFLAEGIKKLKANWRAVQSIINSNLRIGLNECPPPTPSDAPRVGNTAELLYEPSSVIDSITGKRVPGIKLTWQAVHRTTAGAKYKDPLNGKEDFKLYRVYRSDNSIEGPWVKIDSLTGTAADAVMTQPSGSVLGSVTYFVPAEPNIPYRYLVTAVDTAGNESARTGYSYYAVSSEPNPVNELEKVVVLPNPFRQGSKLYDSGENKRLTFANIPYKCTIRIYTVALDLVRTLEHNRDSGIQTWGSSTGKDYMLTDFGQNVAPGMYIYHIESHVPGHEGETTTGKFAIIK